MQRETDSLEERWRKEEADTLLAQMQDKLRDIPSNTVSKLFLNLQIKQSKGTAGYKYEGY